MDGLGVMLAAAAPHLPDAGPALTSLTAAAALACVFAWLDRRTGRDLPAAASGPALRTAAGLCVVLAVAAACWPLVGGDFLGDDFGYVRLFHEKPVVSFLRLGDVSEGIWGFPLDELRPVFALSFKLGLLIHGPVAAGFLATNLLLHAASSLLVVALVRPLAPGRWHTALAAGLIFGLMSVHCEALAWVTGRVDLLPTCFYLAVVVLFVRYRAHASRRAYAAAVALYAVAVFTKEVLVTLPLLLLALDAALLEPRFAGPLPARSRAARLRSLVRLHAPFALVAGGFLALRGLLFANALREGRVSAARLTHFVAHLPDRLRWLLLPFEPWWGSPAADALVAVTLGALAGAGAVLLGRRRQFRPALALAGFFALGLFGITLLPLVVTYMSPRHLYLPSAGVAVALGVLLFPPTTAGGVRTGPARVGALGALLLAQGASLRAAGAQWLEAGRFSREARAQIAAASIPPGSFVLLRGFPASQRGLIVWGYALPMALQPPFTSRDAYGPYRVVESPDVYVRPFSDWWESKHGLLRELLDGPPGDQVEVHVLNWNPARRVVVVRLSRLPRETLQAEARRALGVDADPLAPADHRAAVALVAALADAAHRMSER